LRGDRDTLDFRVQGLGVTSNWVGWLDEKIAYFVDRRSREVIVAEKSDVRIKTDSEKSRSKPFKATIRIGELNWPVVISRDSYDCYREWKFDRDEDERDRAEEQEEKRSRRRKNDRDEGPPTGIQRRSSRQDDDG